MSSRHRWALRPARTAVAVALVFGAATATGTAPAHAWNTSSQPVIVEASSTRAAADAVGAAGGTVDASLPIVSGVAAHVTADALAALEANPALRVTPDVTLHPTGGSFDAAAVDAQVAAVDPGPDWSPDAGRGVGVALVDTGVADTPDLRGSRLVRSPDFSGEGDGIDHYGHGTFMAGLIAGDGSASAGSPVRHFGIAPGATLVSVKVARADGSSSLSRVLEGIGWVVTHRDAYNIGVLNLSFGVDAPVPYFLNPLSAASEAAWASGITVVASAGNRGALGVTSPGDDPYVITVGASDTAGTASTADDTVPAWSGRDRFFGYSKPDVVAPGVSVISLRAPGSTIDVQHPEGRVDATYFRGTGTSMSTAIVSGAAAVLLSHHGNATPDDVKGALTDTATTIKGGAREIDLARAVAATARPGWWQHYLVAFDGLDRGWLFGMPWTATRWTLDSWAATRWTATRWTATRWTATRWTAFDWDASR
ncbi:MAG TPA: S8 family serine peptidase, partial [Acidimicrobiia bacterium]|nr:S8 family serine peptidase [Acidimicrobiia bacterium]